jgi:hypothetical protein
LKKSAVYGWGFVIGVNASIPPAYPEAERRRFSAAAVISGWM